MQIELPHVCDTDENWVSVESALEVIRSEVKPLKVIERVALRDALGRVLARDVVSPLEVPNHTNSAMDGYALNSRDLPKEGNAKLPVVAQSAAGKPYLESLSAGQCCRIFTGAVMPPETDTVIPQERVTRDGDEISIDASHKAGANVRQAGEDLHIGDVAIAAHVVLNAAHIGVAASLGLSELDVIRRPKVAFFSNGDELKSHGESLQLGELYDSNRYTLYSMLKGLGVEIVDLGVVPDDANAIAEAIKNANDVADLVISSAGASVGDLDFMQQIGRQNGKMYFNKVAIKPGRPVCFVRLANSWYFALPGNPVSVMVTFQVFVRAALNRLMGVSQQQELTMMARSTSDLRKSVGRTEYQRGLLTYQNDEWVVTTTGDQGSGILSSMAHSNCFIVLPHDWGKVAKGTLVEILPFANFNF